MSVTLAALLFVLAEAGTAHEAKGAPEAPIARAPVASYHAPTRYCGLHCVYAAAHALGVDFAFGQIVDSQYLSGKYGSTSADLIYALNSVGLQGSNSAFTTLDQLVIANKPAILHVRPLGSTGAYRHWILFLGAQNGLIRIYDPPRDYGSVSRQELLAMWDGSTIMVHKEPLNLAARLPLSYSLLLSVVGLVAALRFLSRWLPGWAVLGIASGVGALAAHLFSSTGFFQSPTAVGCIQASFFDEDIPTVAFDVARSYVESGEVVVVDARLDSDFSRSHLPGAISLPADSGTLTLQHMARHIASEKRVLVYCQSERCGWAARIARQLKARGVSDVVVYQGGFTDWNIRNADAHHSPP